MEATWDQEHPLDEDKYTIEQMKKYGIDNVRGGSFSQVELFTEDRKVIQKMINSSADLCFGCGQSGHFVNNCPGRAKTKPQLEVIPEELSEFELVEEDNDNNKFSCVRCVRCGRTGHKSVNCYAKSDRNGQEIGEHCYRCGRPDHWRINCHQKDDIYGNQLTNDDNLCKIM